MKEIEIPSDPVSADRPGLRSYDKRLLWDDHFRAINQRYLLGHIQNEEERAALTKAGGL